MALVLVRNTVSDKVAEIPEEQLAHPWFGPIHKRVRVNAAGKIYAWNEADPDAPKADDSEETKTADKKASADSAATAKKDDK